MTKLLCVESPTSDCSEHRLNTWAHKKTAASRTTQDTRAPRAHTAPRAHPRTTQDTAALIALRPHASLRKAGTAVLSQRARHRCTESRRR